MMVAFFSTTRAAKTMQASQNSEIITVQAYDWVERDKYGDDNQNVIHCWALNRDSEACLLRILDFPVFCYVELPSFVYNRPYKWDKYNAAKFIEGLSRRLGEDAPTGYTFMHQRKLYYYQGDRKYPMVRCIFKNYDAMRHCSNILKNSLKTDTWGTIYCNVWEANIGCIRKLITAKNSRYSQWFNIEAVKVEDELKISTVKNEYIVKWQTLSPIDPNETKNWKTFPGILSWDIECYSDNHRAMPDKLNALHCAYMISALYKKANNPILRYGIIIGDCNNIPAEKLANCKIIKVDSEKAMIDAFSEVIRETDPEILVGYNILSFDYPYLDHRLKRSLHTWPVMGRIIGENATMATKEWKSGAYGYQSLNLLIMEGRISIDLLPVIRRDYKLDKYTLDFVCRTYLGKTKHDVSAPDMFKIYEDMRNSCTKLVAILQEEQNGNNLEPNFETRKKLAQEEYSRAVAETTRVMEYCIQDSELVIELMEKLNIWVGLVEMASIVGTTVVEIFTRGQQIRCVSQLYDLAAKSGIVLDSRDVPGFKFNGGLVFEPIPGLYENIICLDFSSLYPSIIRAYNFCYTTLVPPDLDNVPDEECNIIEFDQEEKEGDDDDDDDDDEEILKEIGKKVKKKAKIVKRHYRFRFYKGREGLLPQLVRKLVEERKAVNRQIAENKHRIKALEKYESLLIDLEDIKAGVADASIISVESALKYQNDLLAEINDMKENGKSPDSVYLDLQNFASLQLQVAKIYEEKQDLTPILEDLLAGRDKRLSIIQPTLLQNTVLDKRQLALKVSANSFFGFLGVHNGGKMPLIEAAMSITAKGRELITAVRVYIEEKYGGIQVAGDTDSVMMDLKITDPKTCEYWGKRLAEEISGIKPGEKDCEGKIHKEGRLGLFPPPLAMEFEKAMRLLVLRKKKYAAYLVGKSGKFKTEDIRDKRGKVIGQKMAILKRGIVLARRDNSAFLRKTYTDLMTMILDKKPIEDALSVIITAINRLRNNEVPYRDLAIIRELGGNYKSPSYFMKVFGDYLRRVGKLVNPGDRLDFVIVEDPDATLLGHKMRLLEQYEDSLNTDNPLKLDYNYYIEKTLMNPLDQLFAVGYKDTIDKLSDITYKHSNRHKALGLNKPVKIILRMLEKGIDVSVLENLVRKRSAELSAPQKFTLNILSSSQTSCPLTSPRSDSVLSTPKTSPILNILPQSTNTSPIVSPNLSPQKLTLSLPSPKISPRNSHPSVDIYPGPPASKKHSPISPTPQRLRLNIITPQ